MTTYMSTGMGQQSMALLVATINKEPALVDALEGELPELFIFADTGNERAHTYRTVAQVQAWLEELGNPVEFVVVKEKRGQSLSEHVISRAEKGEGGISMPPVFTLAKDGRATPTWRGCTKTFKVRTLDAWIRERYAERIRLTKKTKANPDPLPKIKQVYGISLDEIGRQRNCFDYWREFSYPLIEMNWERKHCVRYLKRHWPHYVGPSSCTFCPFHGPREWWDVSQVPEDLAEAIAFDDALREHGTIAGLNHEVYVHRSRVPLRDIVFEEPTPEMEQLELFGPLGMENACEGMCGV